MQIFTSAADITYVRGDYSEDKLSVWSNNEFKTQLLFLHLHWMSFPHFVSICTFFFFFCDVGLNAASFPFKMINTSWARSMESNK